MTILPQDLADGLKKAGLALFFSECTDSHRREYLRWIEEAKRPDTRKDRIGKALKMIADRKAKEDTRTSRGT